jgi:SanA protein
MTANSMRAQPIARMRRGRRRRPPFGRLLLLAGVLAGGALLGFAWQVQAGTAHAIYGRDDPRLPHHHVGLVFGAGLTPAGEPSLALYDRIATGVDLYQQGKVDKLLMTGDNGSVEYNEVAAMRRTAEALGVPERDIVLDYAGFSTYDSCYRARDVFGLTQTTLVTNAFHLPRALYTCGQLGLDVAGVPADRQWQGTLYNRLRELPALAVTRWSLFVDDKPKFLGPRIDVDAPPYQP